MAVLPLFVTVVVDRTPVGVLVMWPISVTSSTAMYLLMASKSKPGHPWRYPAFAADCNVDLTCDPRLA